MESRLLSSLGKAAGIGGIALGVLLLIFRDILAKKFLPDTGLSSTQAFAVILSLMVLTFAVAGIGVIAWLIARSTGRNTPIPQQTLAILTGLIVVALGASVYIGSRALAQPDGQGAVITTNYTVCVGEPASSCPPGSVQLECGLSAAEWANKECKSFFTGPGKQTPGGKCGYFVSEVTCTKSQ
jgi:hypothetical protein